VFSTTVPAGVPQFLPAPPRRCGGSICVLIADRDQLSAELLATGLKRFRAIQVIGNSTNSSDIRAAIARRSPEVLVISSHLEDGRDSGFKVMRDLREAALGIKLVALLDSSARESVVEAFWSGAHGVFVRSSSFRTLGKCISCVRQGQIWASSEQIRLVLESLTRSALPRLVKNNTTNLLTRREQDVLRCLAEGLSNREIAQRLLISRHTVKNYLLHIFEKLGVSSRVEALLHTYVPDRPLATKIVAAHPEMENDLLTAATNRLLEFYRLGAGQGVLPAQLELGNSHQKGRPRQSDPVSDYVWHELARTTSDRLSANSREARDRLATSMTPEQLTKAGRLIEKWSRWFDSISSVEESGESAAWSKPEDRRAAL
jgi:two-component system nitrate/nitrite response regulator NarL